MRNPDAFEFAPKAERSPLEVAQERFGVDLRNDHATLGKLQELQGKMPDVVDLSNLWQDYQKQKGQGDIEKAA